MHNLSNLRSYKKEADIDCEQHEILWEFDGWAHCNICNRIIKVSDVSYKVSTENLQRVHRERH